VLAVDNPGNTSRLRLTPFSKRMKVSVVAPETPMLVCDIVRRGTTLNTTPYHTTPAGYRMPAHNRPNIRVSSPRTTKSRSRKTRVRQSCKTLLRRVSRWQGARLVRRTLTAAPRAVRIVCLAAIRLLERSTRHVSPTGAGVRFYERMRAATAAMKDAEAEATGTSGSVTGKLRLALPATFGRLWMAPLRPEFLAAHPDVAIEAEYADRYVDIIAEGFDVAIRLGELGDSPLVAKRIASHRRLICAAPSYLAARGTPVTPDDLADHACLSFTRLASRPEWRFRKGIILPPSGLAAL
jgi:hypothetical protein